MLGTGPQEHLALYKAAVGVSFGNGLHLVIGERVFRDGSQIAFKMGSIDREGDGQLTALQILNLLSKSGKPASRLFGQCARYPQVLINIPVAGGNQAKERIMAAQWLKDSIAAQELILKDDGRVLVRPSGTEALIRVMVEAKDLALAQNSAETIANLIKINENKV